MSHAAGNLLDVDAAPLAEAWQRLTYAAAIPPEDLVCLLSAGWTRSHAEAVRRLAVHAWRVGAAVVPHNSDAAEEIALTHRRLLLLGLFVARAGISVGTIEPWLAVVVGEMNVDRDQWLWRELGSWSWAVQEWSEAAGEHAPLAWAAGLSVEETHAQQSAGSLDPMVLKGLAALRGYRLPSAALI